MKNYWYVSRYDEILLDVDGKSEQKLLTSLSRIRGIIEGREFPIKSVWFFPSFTNHHYHIVLNLTGEVTEWEKAALQLYFFSDTFRTACNMMRISRYHSAPDLLIARFSFKKQFGFYRMHDASCNCEEKHSHAVMEKCSAAQTLRGEFAAHTFFNHPIPPEDFFKKRFGKIWGEDNNGKTKKETV